MNKQGFIYALVCPISDEIRYIGQTRSKSINERLNEHVRESKYVKVRYTRKENWIRTLTTIGLVPKVLLVEQVDVAELDSREIYWINFHKNLTNTTAGGTSGYTFPDEVKARISASKQGKANPMFGRTVNMTEQHRTNISTALRSSEKLKQSRSSFAFRDGVASRQSPDFWLILNSKGDLVKRCNSRREVKMFFDTISGRDMVLRNLTVARNKQRPIKRYLDQTYYVCYEKDLQQLKDKLDT